MSNGCVLAPVILSKSSPLPSLMEAKGIAFRNGVLVTVPLKEAVPPRRDSAKVRGDEQQASQANLAGTSPQHRIKSSIHYRARYVYSTPTFGKHRVHPGRSVVCPPLPGGLNKP